MAEINSKQAGKPTRLLTTAKVSLGFGLALNLVRSLMFQYHQDHQLDVHTETFFDLSIYSWGWLLIVGASISFLTSVVFYIIWRLPQRDHA